MDLVNSGDTFVAIRDLDEPKYFGPSFDIRKYVARVEVFKYDQKAAPVICWYCRQDGNIWAQWSIRSFHPEPQRVLDMTISRWMNAPMSDENKRRINRFTQQQWTMHKLGSSTLL